ncbi:hypothetical protein PEPS_00940 [Persicobacter psychrovividus]|uniref:Uncharacterized protein n=1 Tax=Persicobacter psychrovividus TaxID=387638 RepID=A0ABN6L429_9BACT|nr:hypothetical protein PEPS_00940 [Persicobacter psychrovividus]
MKKHQTEFEILDEKAILKELDSLVLHPLNLA